jgi:formylglycine-generating enzyme required for sulfatase activity
MKIDRKTGKMRRTAFIFLLSLVCGILPLAVPEWSRLLADQGYYGGYGDFINSVGMEFVLVPAGTFGMGSPEDERGRWEDETRHEVTLTGNFYLMTTQVTQAQWEAVMGGNPSRFANCGGDCPVENVSWDDVQTFIAALNALEGRYRLPTEAEWEYAARAGTETTFASGDLSNLFCGHDPNLDAMGWYCNNAEAFYDGCHDNSDWGGPSCAGTHPVAWKPPNAWGFHDMHGNVWEWVQDWYAPYPSGPRIDPTGPESGVLRVLRGCAWGSYAGSCRVAYRLNGAPGLRSADIGFRLALTP